MKETDLTNLVIASGKIKKYVQKSVNDLLKPYAISSVHAPYLLLLLNKQELKRKDFNECLNVDKANTTRVIKELEKNEMITYEETPRNGSIYLTNKGIEVAKIIDRWMDYKKQSFLMNVEEEDLQVFIHVLQDIIDALEGE